MRWACLQRTNCKNILHINKMFRWKGLRQNTGFYEKTLTFPQDMFSNWNDDCNCHGQYFLNAAVNSVSKESPVYSYRGNMGRYCHLFLIAVNANSSTCRAGGWKKHLPAWTIVLTWSSLYSIPIRERERRRKGKEGEGERGGDGVGRDRESEEFSCVASQSQLFTKKHFLSPSHSRS